jgi:hypothetical protein
VPGPIAQPLLATIPLSDDLKPARRQPLETKDRQPMLGQLLPERVNVLLRDGLSRATSAPRIVQFVELVSTTRFLPRTTENGIRRCFHPTRSG